MKPVAIPARLLERIYAHARDAFPAECCGYLVGANPATVDDIVPCENAIDSTDVLDRTADRGFVIAGRELFRFAKSFDSEAPARVVYHSHTNGRAYFSDTDHAMAAGPTYPVQHLVVGVTAGSAIECAQFAWSGDVQAFVEIARWPIENAEGSTKG